MYRIQMYRFAMILIGLGPNPPEGYDPSGLPFFMLGYGEKQK